MGNGTQNPLRLGYGLKEGKLLHISEVPRGLACGCVCPACGDRLVARQGPLREHHFCLQSRCGSCRRGGSHGRYLRPTGLVRWRPQHTDYRGGCRFGKLRQNAYSSHRLGSRSSGCEGTAPHPPYLKGHFVAPYPYPYRFDRRQPAQQRFCL